MKGMISFCTILCVTLGTACSSSLATIGNTVAVLPRTSEDPSTYEIAAGLAQEVGHWLSRSPTLRVRDDVPQPFAKSSFVEIRDRLAVDTVIWIDVQQTPGPPAVTYAIETALAGAPRTTTLASGDGMASLPRRIAEDVLSSKLTGWSSASNAAYL